MAGEHVVSPPSQRESILLDIYAMDNTMQTLQKLSDEDFRWLLKEYGWANNNERIIEGALTIIKTYLEQKEQKSLNAIINDVRKLSPYRTLAEVDLILNTVLFIYDRELLIRSKHLISKEWSEIDSNFLDKMNATISTRINKQIYPPKLRKNVSGLSLVVAFKYPPNFQEAVKTHFAPVPVVYFTPKHHFTIFNIGIEIPQAEFARIRNDVKGEIEQKIQQDSRLRVSIQDVFKQMRIRSEIRLMPDGAAQLFGSGAFIETIYELKLKIRDDILRLKLGFIPKRDKQPIWVSTVFARLGRPVNIEAIAQLRDNYYQFQKTWPIKQPITLEEPQLGLLTFEDHKAMIEPLPFIQVSI
jgi:hypothetical protein